jgi:hypothetical protein
MAVEGMGLKRLSEMFVGDESTQVEITVVMLQVKTSASER